MLSSEAKMWGASPLGWPRCSGRPLDARVLALRVLPDGDQVDVVVERLVALDRLAGPHVGVETELLSELQVQGSETLSDGRHERTLEADLVPVYRVDGLLRDPHRAIGVLDRRHVHRLPLDGYAGCGEYPATGRREGLLP